MLKHRCISAALFALALAGCQGRGLQPQSTSAATPATNPTIATTTSEPVVADEAQSSTTATTAEVTTTTEATPETVPVTRPRATVPATTARTAPPTTAAPADSYDTGEWSIPTYIVMCESGGRWDAYNPSGASGPYQLMPFHFGGELAMNQSRAAQHAKAAELWDGGRGRNHWRACL